MPPEPTGKSLSQIHEMTKYSGDRPIKLMSDEDRASLRDAQEIWSSPELVALFKEWDLKQEVMSAYKALRKCGQDPDSALGWALHDWGLLGPEE